MQGSAQGREMLEFDRVNGIILHLAPVKPLVLDVLIRDGLADEIGAANVHESMNDAVQPHLTRYVAAGRVTRN